MCKYTLLIIDETKDFLAGKVSAEQTAKVIDEKVTLYLLMNKINLKSERVTYNEKIFDKRGNYR